MSNIKQILGIAILAFSVSILTAEAADTFEEVGVVDRVSRASGTLTVEDVTYVLPEGVQVSLPANGGSPARLSEGQLVEFSGRNAANERRIIERIVILRSANPEQDRE